MKYKWEPYYSSEEGLWYCQKLIYMCPPDTFGEFETEQQAIKECERLNTGYPPVGEK